MLVERKRPLPRTCRVSEVGFRLGGRSDRQSRLLVPGSGGHGVLSENQCVSHEAVLVKGSSHAAFSGQSWDWIQDLHLSPGNRPPRHGRHSRWA